MRLSGLQKVTLLDYPGKVAATVFLGGCNFRCPYCHNASLVTGLDRAQDISEDEFFTFLQKRAGLLDAVCVSGGEPLLQEGIEPFMERIKSLGFLIKLDTNGSYPDRLKLLSQRGLLDYVAMDIKNAPAKYGQTAGVGADVWPSVQESIAYLLTEPMDYEFRTTLVRSLHTPEDIAEIGQTIRGAKRYYLQNFEDSGDVIQPGLAGFSPSELDAFAVAVRAFVPSAQVRSQ